MMELQLLIRQGGARSPSGRKAALGLNDDVGFVRKVLKWRNHDLQPDGRQGLLSGSCEADLYGRHEAQSCSSQRGAALIRHKRVSRLALT